MAEEKSNPTDAEEHVVMSSIFDLDEVAQETANIRIIKNESEVQRYSDQIAILSSFREIIDYHFPVLKNIEIANDFFDKSLLYLASNNTPFIFSELNRVFCNCVETFYMFDQLCQKRLKWPKELISEYYDRYFEFRFISEIRNYSIHHHLPLTQYETTFGEGGLTQTFNIDVSIIIKDEKVEKKLKSDLDKYLLTDKNN